MNSISSHQQIRKKGNKNFSSNHNTPEEQQKQKKSLRVVTDYKNSCLITFVSQVHHYVLTKEKKVKTQELEPLTDYSINLDI